MEKENKKKPGKAPIYGEPTRLLGKRVPVSKYEFICEVVQAICEGKTVTVVGHDIKPKSKKPTKTKKINVEMGLEDFVTDRMNTLSGAIGVNVSLTEKILDLSKPIPKDCDCYLDEKGLLRRGKSGCKKIKQLHERFK